MQIIDFLYRKKDTKIFWKRFFLLLSDILSHNWLTNFTNTCLFNIYLIILTIDALCCPFTNEVYFDAILQHLDVISQSIGMFGRSTEKKKQNFAWTNILWHFIQTQFAFWISNLVHSGQFYSLGILIQFCAAIFGQITHKLTCKKLLMALKKK